jgi:hypothetical protein
VRMSRWRPVCPECGYSLRGLEKPRCPECGVDLPSASRGFRRWAVRRIPWDRIHRGSLLTAYLGTLVRILFVPWWAGRNLAIPDRWGRATRWAAVHLLLCAIGAVLLSQQDYYVYWLKYEFHPLPRHPSSFFSDDVPIHCICIWVAQSLLAWMLVLASFPLTGVLISLGVPCRHRAAKITGVKWSLYATPILMPALAVWFGYYLIWPQTGYYVHYHPTLPPSQFAWAYGIWWAAGMCINQYDSAFWRGPPAFLLGGLFYAGAWLALTQLLFPGGIVEGLL